MATLNGILQAINDGLALAAKLAPLAEQFGGPIGMVAGNIVTSMSSILQNVQQRVNEGEFVATSVDTDQINTLARNVQTLNEQLDKYIQAS